TKLVDTSIKDNPISKSVMFSRSKISYGEPLVRYQDELELKMPRYDSDRFDVYWIEFGVTYEDMDLSEIQELIFGVSLPPSCVEVEIAPVRVGRETHVEEERKTPEIGIGVGDAVLTVGEFYGVKLSYDFIKPTIVGFGKRQTKVHWSITDDAISLGSHTF